MHKIMLTEYQQDCIVLQTFNTLSTVDSIEECNKKLQFIETFREDYVWMYSMLEQSINNRIKQLRELH